MPKAEAAPEDVPLTLPLSPGRIVTMTVPPGLTLAEYERMVSLLLTMKPGLLRFQDHPDPAAALASTRPRDKSRREDPSLDTKMEVVAESNRIGVKAAGEMFGFHAETITRWRRELAAGDARENNGGGHAPDAPLRDVSRTDGDEGEGAEDDDLYDHAPIFANGERPMVLADHPSFDPDEARARGALAAYPKD